MPRTPNAPGSSLAFLADGHALFLHLHQAAEPLAALEDEVGGCTAGVVGAEAVDGDPDRVEEAPRSAASAFVQVAGEVVTTCAGDAPAPAEQVAATVEVRRGGDGLWRVAKRLY